MSGELLWYLSRATGAAATVLLTLVVVLGVVTAGRRSPQGPGATVVLGMHRWVSLGALVFLAVHIATAILDGYVTIGWLAVLVPFTSPYLTLLVGLGTIALDLLAVVLVTSYLRHRMPERALARRALGLICHVGVRGAARLPHGHRRRAAAALGDRHLRHRRRGGRRLAGLRHVCRP